MRWIVWAVCLCFLALTAVPAPAAPFIFYRGVLNAASFVPPGLSNGSIARGSIFSVFGRGLGPAQAAQVSAFPLGTELAGVSIEVCQGRSCVAAIPLFVRADQINAIMPSNAPLGQVSMRVTFEEEAGNWLAVRVVQASLGVFAVNSGGFGPGVLQNFISQTEQPINSAVATARPGQVVTMWGTGLGPGLNADQEAPQPGGLPVSVEIWVGGAPATNILYAGRTPCCAGVDQIVFEIPAAAPNGCYVPVEARVNGTVVSNTVSMAIASGRDSCSDPGSDVMSALRSGGRTGLVTLLRQTQYHESPDPYSVIEKDIATGEFREDAGGPFTYHPDWALPPVGSCITHSARGANIDHVPQPGTAATIRALDAGETLAVQGGGGAIPVPKRDGRPHAYLKLAGARFENSASSTLIQGAGSPVTVSGGGGPDVGAFAATVPAPPAINWTNRTQLVEIDRDDPLTLRWSGTPPDALVWIWGGVSDFPTDSTTTFSCLALGGAGAFTVPEQALMRLPALRLRRDRSRAWLSIGALAPSGAVPFTAEGLDRGFAGSFRQVLQAVRYQ